jgi:hypothetical protein
MGIALSRGHDLVVKFLRSKGLKPHIDEFRNAWRECYRSEVKQMLLEGVELSKETAKEYLEKARLREWDDVEKVLNARL